MSTALKRIAMSVQPSLRGRVFALLVGLTLCACAGATATYWLARALSLTLRTFLRQVNLRQQVRLSCRNSFPAWRPTPWPLGKVDAPPDGVRRP